MFSWAPGKTWLAAPDKSSEETVWDKISDVEFGDTDCVFSVPVWRFICALKAPANCGTLVINKILIRYFSSQTETAQKLRCLHFGTHFAFPHFSGFLRWCKSQTHNSALPHKTQTILHEPTISRLKTAASRVDENSHKYLIILILYSVRISLSKNLIK